MARSWPPVAPAHRGYGDEMPDRVVIIGAGNAGISLAARLERKGLGGGITLVDSRAVHRYRPLLSYVGAGLVEQQAISRPTTDVVPDGVRLVADDAVSVDPDRRTVVTASGEQLVYDTLVVAAGLDVDHPAVPGLEAAYASGWAVSTFVDDTASTVWERVRTLTAGTAVFTVPPEPAPCAATALKPLFMACDHWRRAGVLRHVQVHAVLPGARPLAIVDSGPNDELERRLADVGVVVHRSSTVVGVDHANRTVTVSAGSGATTIEAVDLAHVVPHYRGPRWVADAGLDNGSDGRVAVDPETMRHASAASVWALGDVADLGIPSSGGALRPQVEVLTHNLLDPAGELRRYDGYTVMPVTVDRRRLMLVEVDRSGRPAPTTRLLDLTKPRRSTFLFDRFGLPQVYYRRILRGLV